MHVATRRLLAQHFAESDFAELQPLVNFYFTDDASGLTDVYFSKILKVSRTNMYQKKKRFLEILKAGEDYSHGLSADNKKIITFTHTAFLRCVRESDQPATSEENRRRINMVFKLQYIMTAVLTAHATHYKKLIEEAQDTLYKMKQLEANLMSDIERLNRLANRVVKENEELQERNVELART